MSNDVTIVNPDDEFGSPAYDGPAGQAHTKLAPGLYPTTDASVDVMVTETDATAIWTPEFAAWRHGGWYVTNVQHPSGAVGCVSRNYPDKKWRIVCDPRPFEEAPTFRNRDEAARAERELIRAVHTWADGFGTWHASVTEQGVGDADLARRLAYRAILAELEQREAHLDRARFEVRQVSRTSQDGVLVTEFVESWPTDKED